MWWSLFSVGGVVAAFLVPVHIFLTGIAWPLGIFSADFLQYSKMQVMLSHPVVRLYCFVLIALPLFHWAHRFRFTLIDLGLKSIPTLIAILCYGSAIAGTIVAAAVLWR